MPSSYRIDRERRVVFSVATGAVTNESMRDFQDRLRSDPEFDPSFRHLLDLRGLSTGNVSSAGVRSLISGNPFAPGTRTAVVTARELDFGHARMYELMSDTDPEDFKVVRTLDEALFFLELEGVDVE